MYYSQEIIDNIRDRIDIVDLIQGYVKLKKTGGSYVGLCPFHSEKTPSFSVSPARQFFHCFGCGKGGDIFTFIRDYENLTYPEAIEELAGRAGVTLPKDTGREASAGEKKRQRIFLANREAARYYYYLLRSPAGTAGMDYLKKRALSEETLHHFGLGFAPGSRDNLVRYLREKGFSDAEIREASLAAFDEERGARDLFWNRVIFPVQDVSGRVIGFGGRVLGEGEPKYLNSRETAIFDKGKNLYGLNFARKARKNRLILCEGYMDVIAMHQAGFTEAVASLGTAFTSSQAAVLRRYTENVYLAYDSDGPGVKAALRAAQILRDAGITGKVISLSPCKDPDEFIRTKGVEEYERRILQAENSFLFELRKLYEESPKQDPDARTRFARDCATKLLVFEDPIERENYLEAVAETYGFSSADLREMLQRLAAGGAGRQRAERVLTREERRAEEEQRKGRSEKLLLRWLFEEPALLEETGKYLTPEDFIPLHTGRLAGVLFARAPEDRPVLDRILFELDEEDRDFATGLLSDPEQEWEALPEKEKALKELIRRVLENSIQYHSRDPDTDIAALLKKKKLLQRLSSEAGSN